MKHAPDDVPGETAFRAEFGPYLEALKEMWLDEAIRPTLPNAVRKEIAWEEFREYLRGLEERRGDQGFPG
ncbi:MAG: hypothetical protein HKN13_01445 [Rhodothermales bacterium]|nr:hypothetical protein [Rhodothermales bacterium]